MTPPYKIEFDYDVEAFGQSVTVTATVRLPPPGHPHGNDPDNDAELEIDSVTLNGSDIDPDDIKVVRMRLMPAHVDTAGYQWKEKWLPEWFLLTELLRVAAWERAEREAA